MCKVYTGYYVTSKMGIVCPSVRSINPSLKLVDYLFLRADNHALSSTYSLKLDFIKLVV